nr:unnamed protein product [Digitaria exilis]
MSAPGGRGVGFGGAGAAGVVGFGFGFVAGDPGLLCGPEFFGTQTATADGGATAVARRRMRRQARSGGGGVMACMAKGVGRNGRGDVVN